jgi:hypothetical protein
MRGRDLKLLALAITMLIAGAAILGLGTRSNGGSNALRVSRPDSARAIGKAGRVAFVQARSTSTRVARPHVIRALRNVQPRQAEKLGPQAQENEALALRPASSRDGAIQGNPGRGMPAPIQNFEGLANVNGSFRPDTAGDVGPNHYMQWINFSFAIYNKQGTMVYGPAAGSTLFPGSSVCGTRNGGDPVVLYDQFAGRWFASQSAYQSLVNGPYYQCVAVSRTSDPTAGWCSYQFLSHPSKFVDYPKFGVWPAQNAYVMTSPQFTRGSTFSGVGIWAYERNRVLGCQSARVVYQDMNSIAPDLPRMLPADADGMAAPPAGTAAPLLAMNWTGSGLPENTLQVWKAAVNWSSNASLAVKHDSDIQTAAYDSNLCNYARACIGQPGTTSKVDALGDRLMYRLGYRNFGDHQTMVVNHTVDTGADHAGIRWYELRKTSANWGIHQQGTFSPDGVNRFMGSAAMDRSGDIAVGYSVAGPNTFPGIRYAGRLADDPAGTLGQGEVTLVNGTGVQTQSTSHWGDYSMMSVDPRNDCTFWYAQEYYTETGKMAWHTRIGSFKFPSCRGIGPTN